MSDDREAFRRSGPRQRPAPDTKSCAGPRCLEPTEDGRRFCPGCEPAAIRRGRVPDTRDHGYGG